LGNLDVNIAFGFGLFAVFAILRYRTNPIPIKEMTYLFIVITIGVINALSKNETAYAEVLFANAAIVILTFVLEKYWESNILYSKTLVYNDLVNLRPENRQLLLQDLIEKTGLDIISCKVGRINLIDNRSNIKIYYKDSD
tara:strand:+ start:112 stop:531 length:420 start_codon:yes stop_codon:yes gene_type:complete